MSKQETTMISRIIRSGLLMLAVLLMIAGMQNGMRTYAAETEETGYTWIQTVNPMYAGKAAIKPVDESNPMTVSETEINSVEDLIAYIRNELASRSTGFGFSLAGEESLTLEDVEILLYAAMEPYSGSKSYEGDAIYSDFLGGSLGMEGGYDETGVYYTTYYIYPQYCTTAEQEMALRSAVTSTLSSLGVTGVSDYEKIRKIYDYICSNVRYDYANLENSSYYLQYSAYAAMIHKTSVCQGYASLLYRMCTEAGIPSRLITGTSFGEGHAWNIVKVDGSYYNVDATWDSGDDGTVYYSYFLKCDADFPDHQADSYFLDSSFVGQHVKSGVSYNKFTTYLGNYVSTIYGVIDTTVNGPLLVDKRWYYMINGVCDSTFTGLIKDGDVWYSYVNGICDTTYSRLTEHDGVYYHITNGVVDWSYTGLSAGAGVWHYVENGVVNWEYTGLVDYAGATYYVVNGTMDVSISGLICIDGTWYKIFNATLDKYYTGPVKHNNVWYYVANGILDWSYTGLCKNPSNGLWFYVKDGKIDWTYTGLTKYNGLWFYVENGMLNWNFTGFCKNQGIWFYVNGGMVDWNFTGLAKFNGIWFYAKGGMIDWTYTGLCKNNGIWFYVNGGMVDWSFTGVTKYNGVWFYVENGMLNWDYIGLCEKDGVLYYVSGGMIDWSYTGSAVYEGTEYSVVGGYVHE